VIVESGDLISTASIIVGFGVTVIMFRVQRELHVLEELKRSPLWLAWADYLVIASVALAIVGVILPLLVLGGGGPKGLAASTALCAAAIVLQGGYIPAILAHYRIELGAERTGSREKGEPLERLAVKLTVIGAVVVFAATIMTRWPR